jgi:hypothetical protein
MQMAHSCAGIWCVSAAASEAQAWQEQSTIGIAVKRMNAGHHDDDDDEASLAFHGNFL